VSICRTRSVRMVLAVVCTGVVGVGLLPSIGEAQPKLTLAQVQSQIAALDVEAEVSQEALNTAQIAMASGQVTLATINARVARSRAALSTARMSVGRLASAAYRSGGVDQTLQLLLADNPTQFLAEISALDGVTNRQSDVLRIVMVAQQRLAQDNLAAAQQLGRLQQLRAAAARNYSDVQAKVAEAKALFDSLQASQRAEILKEQAQARAKAVAAAQAAAARAVAEARSAAAAAAARAAAARRPVRHSPGRASTGSGRPPSRHPTRGPVSASGIGARVVAFALSKVGDSYVWGASGPSAWDCSGLTMKAYASVGITLPHSSAAQYNSGRRISASALQPGDLVFYYSPIHHVGIYIGGGMIVNAANPGAGVTTDPLFSMPFSGAVRPY
jgi:peptidoglycan DL-endopeptidase CwlO